MADQKARTEMILALNPSELCHIKHCETPTDVWNLNLKMFMNRSTRKEPY